MLIRAAVSLFLGVNGPGYWATKYCTIAIESFNSNPFDISFIQGIIPKGACVSLSKSSPIGLERR
jgi:hypothetical protein